MAYNREWDQGKDNWNETTWTGPDTKVPRQREEDYQGEGKRRKFNNGVCLPKHDFSAHLTRSCLSRLLGL